MKNNYWYIIVTVIMCGILFTPTGTGNGESTLRMIESFKTFFVGNFGLISGGYMMIGFFCFMGNTYAKFANSYSGEEMAKNNKKSLSIMFNFGLGMIILSAFYLFLK